MSRFFKSAAFPILIVVVLAFFAQKLISPGDQQKDKTYSDFVTQVDQGQVKEVTLNTKNNRIDVKPIKGSEYQTAYPDNTEQNLVNKLQAEGIEFDVKAKSGSGWLTALTYILPFVIFLLFWLFIINQMQGGAQLVDEVLLGVVRVGGLVLVAVLLLDVDPVVLRVERDLLDLVVVDLGDELAVARVLLLLARADQLLGEERQHDDDQDRKCGALEESAHRRSLYRRRPARTECDG